ncbi:MAG: L,D-transpeptidase family protein, partial [Deltaproteobacteria bacterium]|nr:L,D-transpeptidase family protein [Deltaproteobacteria bacterium]
MAISWPLNAASAPCLTDSGLLNLELKVFIAAKPISLILVEKDSHGLQVLRHDGRLQVIAEFRIGLGTNFGRKEIEGDEKTPEGIYFITKKYIDHRLTVFGTRAFHLNYPNVFDSLAGRDGNGIYIHGTNRALRYNSSNGCVALNDHDLAGLARFLKVGTVPVIIVPNLLELKNNQVKLPDLTADNFALARKLLMPPGISPKAEFRNLYLLRVNDQTLMAGEYGEKGRAGKFSANYIKFYPRKGWEVLEHIPDFAAGETSPKVLPADNSPEFFPASIPVSTMAGDADTDKFALWSWPAPPKDIYLSWYRSSLRHRQELEVRGKPPEADRASLRPMARFWESGILPGALALICLVLAAALIFLVFRLRRTKIIATDIPQDNGRQIIIDNAFCQRQTDRLQHDINFMQNTLKTLETHLEETRLMDKQELQARIDDLETGLRDKQEEIKQLIAEKSALKLKGMSHLSSQVEELGLMRHDLRNALEKAAESRRDMERLPALEQMLVAEQKKSQKLALENAALQNHEVGGSAALEAAKSSDLQQEL